MILTKPRRSQELARDAALSVMREGGGFLLLQDPRVGKTLSALMVADRLPAISTIWVICPKNANRIWDKAFKTEWRPPASLRTVHINNYEQYVAKRKYYYREADKLTQSNFLIIGDEIHFIKDRGTDRSRVTRNLAGRARWRLGLTGTLMEAGPEDAWATFDYIDPEVFGPWDDGWEGGLDGRPVEGFESRYIVYGGFKKKEIVRYKHLEEFKEKLHRYSYRVTLRESRKLSGEVSLKVRHRRVEFDLERKARGIYDTLEEELVATVNQKKVKAKNVLACVMKLQQITGGSLIVPPDEGWADSIVQVGQEKLEALHTQVRSLTARSKFVVVARFIHEIETIARSLLKLNYDVEVVRGGRPYSGTFNADCIVLQVQSGIAVDMSAADTVISYSIDYSSIRFKQAMFRILDHSKPQANYIYLLAKNTVDEQIYEAATGKARLVDLICDTYRRRKT